MGASVTCNHFQNVGTKLEHLKVDGWNWTLNISRDKNGTLPKKKGGKSEDGFFVDVNEYVCGSWSQPNYLEIATLEIHFNISEIFTYSFFSVTKLEAVKVFSSNGPRIHSLNTTVSIATICHSESPTKAMTYKAKKKKKRI